MKWRYCGMSVRGSSHKYFKTCCQDDFIIEEISRNDKSYLISIVSDGAGSAIFGREGAEIACQSGFNILNQAIFDTNYLDNVTEKTVCNWICEIRNYISIAASSEGRSIRDFACTIVGSIIGENISIFFQIGDGGIVLKNNNQYFVVFWPNEGLYVNMTNFITDKNFLDQLKVTIIPNTFDGVSLFTDGLQRQILDLQKKEAYPRFFNYIFQLLEVSNDEVLFKEIEGVLDGEEINKRTDDDRTLVIALNNLH